MLLKLESDEPIYCFLCHWHRRAWPAVHHPISLRKFLLFLSRHSTGFFPLAIGLVSRNSSQLTRAEWASNNSCVTEPAPLRVRSRARASNYLFLSLLQETRTKTGTATSNLAGIRCIPNVLPGCRSFKSSFPSKLLITTLRSSDVLYGKPWFSRLDRGLYVSLSFK